MISYSFLGKLESDKNEKKNRKTSHKKPASEIHVFTEAGEFKESTKINPLVVKFLIDKIGEKKLEFIADTFRGFCKIGILVSSIMMFTLAFFSGFIEEELVDWSFFLSFILFFSALIAVFTVNIIDGLLKYHRDAICRNCGEKFACEEIKKPIVKEVSTSEEYTITATRHWKCKYCGNVDIREEIEDIITKKGDMMSPNYLKEIQCKKCKEYQTVEEFKKPDVKEIGNTRTERRYIICSRCGHEDIIVREETTCIVTGG